MALTSVTKAVYKHKHLTLDFVQLGHSQDVNMKIYVD